MRTRIQALCLFTQDMYFATNAATVCMNVHVVLMEPSFTPHPDSKSEIDTPQTF